MSDPDPDWASIRKRAAEYSGFTSKQTDELSGWWICGVRGSTPQPRRLTGVEAWYLREHYRDGNDERLLRGPFDSSAEAVATWKERGWDKATKPPATPTKLPPGCIAIAVPARRHDIPVWPANVPFPGDSRGRGTTAMVVEDAPDGESLLLYGVKSLDSARSVHAWYAGRVRIAGKWRRAATDHRLVLHGGELRRIDVLLLLKAKR